MPGLRNNKFREVKAAAKPAAKADSKGSQTNAKPKSINKQPAIPSEESFQKAFADEHEKHIHKFYAKLPNHRKEIIKQLKAVKSTIKDGQRVIDKLSAQNPYNNIRKRLKDIKETRGKKKLTVNSTVAEAVRVMSPNQSNWL